MLRVVTFLLVGLICCEAEAQRFSRRGRTARTTSLRTTPSVSLRGFFFQENDVQLNAMERLGEQIFNDPILSFPVGQSCSTCHFDEAGMSGRFSDVNQTFAVQFGAEPGAIGIRRPPNITYLADIVEPLTFDEENERWFGGILLDGRSTGFNTGDPLGEQHAFVVGSAIFADGEMNAPFDDDSPMPASQYLVEAVNDSNWRRQFIRQFGRPEADTVALNLSLAIAAFLRSEANNEFSSKFDAVSRGDAEFTEEEQRGFDLFMSDTANCSNCHPPPFFTDRRYRNIGVPENPLHPTNIGFGDPDFVDLGLGLTLLNLGDPQGDAADQMGKFMTPTLRNVTMVPDDQPNFVKALTHNGFFKNLEDFLMFLSDRTQFPEAEVPVNVSGGVGALMLSQQQQSDIIAFLHTLEDGWEPEEEEELEQFFFGNRFNIGFFQILFRRR